MTSRKPVRRDHAATSARRRRAERAEVAQHDVVDRRVGGERRVEPCLGGGDRHLAAPAPQPAWRYLDEREQAPAGVGERGGVEVGEVLRQRAAQLGAGVRLLGEHGPAGVEHRREVDSPERRPEVPVPGELGVEHGLHQRSQDERVGGGDEVDRAAHHDDADDLAVGEQPGELLGVEAGEPGPEREIWVRRLLRLQADEMCDGVEDRPVRPLEQQLTGERRPVQRRADSGRRATSGDELLGDRGTRSRWTARGTGCRRVRRCRGTGTRTSSRVTPSENSAAP